MVSQISQPRQQLASDRMRIMIVEDEQTTRRAMSLLLATCGYQPQAFASAEEALRGVRAGELPQFALVDLDLPGMSGLDLIERLATLDPSVQPILVTATDEDTLYRRIAGRPIAYLRKPVDFDILLSLLRQHRSPSSSVSHAR